MCEWKIVIEKDTDSTKEPIKIETSGTNGNGAKGWRLRFNGKTVAVSSGLVVTFFALITTLYALTPVEGRLALINRIAGENPSDIIKEFDKRIEDQKKWLKAELVESENRMLKAILQNVGRTEARVENRKRIPIHYPQEEEL